MILGDFIVQGISGLPIYQPLYRLPKFGMFDNSAFEAWKVNPAGGASEKEWQRQRASWARRLFKKHNPSQAQSLNDMGIFAKAFSVIGKGLPDEQNTALLRALRTRWRQLFQLAAETGELYEGIQYSYPILTDLRKGMRPLEESRRNATARPLLSVTSADTSLLFPDTPTFRLPPVPKHPSKLDYMLATYAVPTEQPKTLPKEKLTELYHGFMQRVVDTVRIHPVQASHAYPHIARAAAFFAHAKIPMFGPIPATAVHPGKHFFQGADWVSTLLFQPELPSVQVRGERQRRACYSTAHRLAAMLARVAGKPNFRPQDRDFAVLSDRRYFARHSRPAPGESFKMRLTGTEPIRVFKSS
jgi:hypothetical protein